MTENVGSGLAPLGDRFEDQYTRATADLSAGGVATALDSMQSDPARDAPSIPTPSQGSPPSRSVDYSSPVSVETGSLAKPRTIGLGTAALLSIGGAAGGAWLYARWQRERNKPINRLRRRAKDVASRIGERIPDVDDLPRGAAPMSGAATALLLTGLLASRALQRGSDNRADDLRDQASDLLRDSLREALGHGRDAIERGRSAADRGRELADRGSDVADLARDVVDRGRKESRRLVSHLPTDRPSVDHLPLHAEPHKPAFLGLGFGVLSILAGGCYLIWRMLRGNIGAQGAWQAGS